MDLQGLPENPRDWHQYQAQRSTNKLQSNVPKADVAELVDALDLGSSAYGVRVRVSSSASSAQAQILTSTPF